MLHVTRKRVFGICDQVRLKPTCSAPGTSQGIEILDIASIDIILSKQRTTKALIRLRGCILQLYHSDSSNFPPLH